MLENFCIFLDPFELKFTMRFESFLCSLRFLMIQKSNQFSDEEKRQNVCSNTNIKLPFSLQRKFSISVGNFFSLLLGTLPGQAKKSVRINEWFSTFADTSDTSRIILSNSAFPSASFWFSRAIFSENFRGFAIFFFLETHFTKFSTEFFSLFFTLKIRHWLRF